MSGPFSIAAFAALGLVSGLAYLSLLARHVRALTECAQGVGAVLSQGRILLVAATLAFAAMHGAAALIAAFAGFLLSRAGMLGAPGRSGS